MSGEPQLERSVLEGKERDKLQAIAEALGLKPTARAKKADLIDGILRATGVEVAPAETEAARPKRTTRKRAAATVEASNGGEPTSASTVDLADQAEDRQPSSPIHTQANAAIAEPADAAVEASRSDNGEPAGSGGRVEPAGSGGRVEPAGSGGRVEPAGSGGRVEPAGSGGTVEPAAVAALPSADEQVARNGGDPASTVPQPRPQPPRPAAEAPGLPGPGNHASPPQGNQSQQSPAGQPQPGQPGQPAAPGEAGEGRRNRRRRGRDRDRLSAGYDQQAQQADQAYSGDPIPCDGLLEVRPEGFGFLRTSGYLTGPDDVYVSMSQIRKFALRAGDRIVGASRPATTQERFGALLRIDTVGDQSPEEARQRPRFEDLTPVFPDQRLSLGLGDPSAPANATGRIIDLFAPVGKGQRGLIVAPPRAGKSTVMKHIAEAIETNHPDVDLMVVLVDERPEEITDMSRSVKGEVIGSTFERPPEEHTHVAELAIELAKRRAELGRDVVVILDGITRLVRAYNLSAPPNGRTLPAGIDASAIHPPKKLLGAARNLEEGGSLTVLATVLVGTGSAADAAIFDELQGVANMQLRLDPLLAERRLYPSIDVRGSSTLREELLLAEEELRQATELRRTLPLATKDGTAAQAYEQLLSQVVSSRRAG